MDLIKMINNKLVIPSLQYYKIYIQTLPVILNIFLIMAILSIFITNPDGQILEKTYYNISLSFIASYIFFVIVVHSKEIKDREKMNCFIELHVWRIINEYKTLMKDLNKNAHKITQQDYFTFYELENLLNKTEMNGKSAIVKNLDLENLTPSSYLTWHECFIYSKKSSIDEINIIINLPFLDVELIELLAKIKTCSHFEFHGHLLSFKMGPSYKFYTEIFYKYFRLIEDLDRYYVKNLYKYNLRK